MTFREHKNIKFAMQNAISQIHFLEVMGGKEGMESTKLAIEYLENAIETFSSSEAM